MVNKRAEIGKSAPLFIVSDWVQGQPASLDHLKGRVVLIEVFQVNCPGCFLNALPLAIDLYKRYSPDDLAVIGIATAFEDFDKNNLTNLRRLSEEREVIGETYKALNQRDLLTDGKLPYTIPFPLAMDMLVKKEAKTSEAQIYHFIREHIPDFDEQSENYRASVFQQVLNYFEKLEYRAQTFELFNLKGTPSYILIDKQGILRDCRFGDHSSLEAQIQHLLAQ